MGSIECSQNIPKNMFGSWSTSEIFLRLLARKGLETKRNDIKREKACKT